MLFAALERSPSAAHPFPPRTPSLPRAGCLCASLLAQRGFTVDVFEQRQEPVASDARSHRSYPMVRGLRVCARAVVMWRGCVEARYQRGCQGTGGTAS